LDQFQYCETNGIPVSIIIGQTEIENNVVTLRVVATREEVSVTLTITKSLKLFNDFYVEFDVPFYIP